MKRQWYFLPFVLVFLSFIIPFTVHAQSCPYKSYGDANCDGILTSVDEVTWKNEYLKQIPSLSADFNGDDKITLIDLEIFIRSLINGLPNLIDTPTTIPATPTPAAGTPTAIPPTTGITVTSVPPTATPIPSGATYPAQVLDLTNWKMTIPTGSSESPTEIKQPALATYKVDPWFIVTPQGDGVRFRAPVNAVTTSGSNYPRSELREMANNGSSNANWSSTLGVHTMIIDEAITAVPRTKKHIVAGQIHDAGDDVIVIRLEYPKLFIDINGADGPVLESNYVLGTRFTVKFVASNGQTRIYYNNSASPAYTLDQSYSGAYFKAGAYTQSNCSTEGSGNCVDDNYGEVIIYGVTINHQ